MQNIGETLTSNEKKIIKDSSDEMIKSFTRLGITGHKFFDELKEAYGDEVDDLDVRCAITDTIILYERLQNEPHLITSMGDNDLLVMKLVILDKLPRIVNTIAKRNLIQKINYIIELRTINEN